MAFDMYFQIGAIGEYYCCPLAKMILQAASWATLSCTCRDDILLDQQRAVVVVFWAWHILPIWDKSLVNLTRNHFHCNTGLAAAAHAYRALNVYTGQNPRWRVVSAKTSQMRTICTLI
jgi:hypothetical protein